MGGSRVDNDVPYYFVLYPNLDIHNIYIHLTITHMVHERIVTLILINIIKATTSIIT